MPKMKPIIGVVKWILMIWGAVSLAAVIGMACIAGYSLGPGNREKIEKASPPDVRFVLNRCQLGDKRIEKVVHSYESARSFTGDHLDAYEIQISHLETEGLTSNMSNPSGCWYRGDQLPKILDDTMRSVGAFVGEIPWFPNEAELRSEKMYVFPTSIYCHGISPSAADLIFVRPSDKMIFYISFKT